MSSTQVGALASVQEKVQERIRAQLADLIPEEMWAGLVQTETKKFLETEIPKVVQEELKKSLQAALTAELNKPEWREQWTGSSLGPKASEMLAKAFKDAAPELVAAMFANVGSYIVNGIRNGNYGRI